MFISCPHCRDLVATDRETGLPPLLCTRCGGVLRESQDGPAAAEAPAGTARSFVSFLRDGEALPSPVAASTPAGIEDTHTDQGPAPQEVSGNGPMAIGPRVAGPVEPDTVADAAVDTDTDNDTDNDNDNDRDDAEAPVLSLAGPQDPESPRQESAALAQAADVLPPAGPPAAEAAPSFMRAAPATHANPRAMTWQWLALIALATALLLQVLVADRTRLAADASWRPLITSLCGVLGCSVPAWHQPGAISMLSRDVSPIPGRAGALNVRATFRNDARWSQPWPVLLLSLSDADGRVLGSRAFTPAEYMGHATQSELAPGQSAQIALQLHEPDPDVVAFSFDFR